MAGGIDQLIVNGPYGEPERHWRYDRESRTFSLEAGRRPAGYVVATQGSKSFDDPGLFVELPLVNRIRPRVQAWREAGYPGVTGTTLRLLQHWRDPETWEERRFFFCQLEAVETLIWLTEAPAGERQGIEVPGDGGPFNRLCSKMATGSGKMSAASPGSISMISRDVSGCRRSYSRRPSARSSRWLPRGPAVGTS
jgi:type III restriction enzyme